MLERVIEAGLIVGNEIARVQWNGSQRPTSRGFLTVCGNRGFDEIVAPHTESTDLRFGLTEFREASRANGESDKRCSSTGSRQNRSVNGVLWNSLRDHYQRYYPMRVVVSDTSITQQEHA